MIKKLSQPAGIIASAFVLAIMVHYFRPDGGAGRPSQPPGLLKPV